jgi:hypothetical protein
LRKSRELLMKRLHCIVLSLWTFAVIGCQYNPFAHRFLKKEPTIEEASGTYHLKEVYVDMVKSGLSETISAHQPQPEIILRPDGSADLQNFPLFVETKDFNYEFSDFVTLKARWTISPTGAVSSGDSASAVYGVSLEPVGSDLKIDSANFTGQESPDGMIFTLYDGDQGQILGFEKR